MLNTLENRDLRDREKLLASVAKRLLPQPFVETKKFTKEETALLKEMREQLELKPRDNSPAAITKLLQLLSDEMSAVLRSDSHFTQLQARLEQFGDLWPEHHHNTALLDTTSASISRVINRASHPSNAPEGQSLMEMVSEFVVGQRDLQAARVQAENFFNSVIKLQDPSLLARSHSLYWG